MTDIDVLIVALREMRGPNVWEAAAALERMRDELAALKQCEASYNLAGLGADVHAAWNAGRDALMKGCKEERLRAEAAEAEVARMRDELAETTEAFQDQMTATATYMDKMESAEAEVARLREALRETLKKPDGWLVDEGFMLVDPKDKYAIPLYYISPELAALAQRSEL